MFHNPPWHVNFTPWKGFLSDSAAWANAVSLYLLWSWQKIDWSTDTYSACLSVHLLVRLSIFLHAWLPSPAVNKHPDNTRNSHHTHICTHTLLHYYACQENFFFFLFCDVCRHSTLLLPLTVIGTSVPNQVFTFCRWKKTVLQQTHFIPRTHAVMSVGVIYFGCWPSSPRLFTQHFYHS